MFPLKHRKLVLSFQGHIQAGRGGAADYQANFEQLFMPFEGTLEKKFGPEGGNWLVLTRPNGDRIEFAHLSQYLNLNAKVGEPIAITGNTGQITTGPHLHIQIFRNGQRIDPEKYDWITPQNATVGQRMTEQEVTLEYNLAFYRDPTPEELAYWSGKPLVEFLKAAIKDRTEFLSRHQ